MAKPVDLRKLKDEATRALEKRNYDRAAALYIDIAEREPEPDWRQRAGEAFRRSGDTKRALEELTRAATGYANNGFLLKAIAVNKTILSIDAAHTETQRALAELYARRDGGTAPVVPQVLRPHAPLSPPVPLVEIAPPKTGDVSLLAIDEALDAEPHAGASAPIDVLPLHRVLGGKRAAEAHVGATAPAEPEPAAYEIMLDDETDFTEVSADDAVEIAIDAPPALPTIPLFSSLGADDLHMLIERVQLRELAAGEVVVRHGDTGGSLFVVVEGTVRVIAPQGEELARLEAGAFFGELGLLSDEPRSATVETATDVRLLEISRDVAWDVIRRSPEVLRTLLRFFRDRMLDRLLSTSPLFAPLSPEDGRTLAEQFVFLELEAGATAVKEGARAPGLYLVVCGEVEVVRSGERLGKLGPGEVFGEMSLLNHAAATADVRAVRKSWALQLPQSHFQEIMLTYPQVLAYVSDLADARRPKSAASTPDDAAPNSSEGSSEGSHDAGMLGILDLLSDERIDIL